jgi:very-short-patch-repair endonuclease
MKKKRIKNISGSNNPNYRYTDEEIQQKANLCRNNKEFQSKYSPYYYAATRRGILGKIRKNMKMGKRVKISEEEIRNRAKECSSKMEFSDKYPSDYNAARTRPDFEDICAHMKKLRRYWPKDVIIEKAKLCGSRSQFEQKFPSAYRAAIRLGILEEVCRDMPILVGSSRAEIDIFKAIKAVYKTARKMRHYGIKIKNRPYIQRFEIDIFVPELNRGIEYDGDYYHSFERMRGDPCKKNWPNGALRQYDKIKDGYFLTKGIRILHIKEKHWNRNKEACLKKIFDFLSK